MYGCILFEINISQTSQINAGLTTKKEFICSLCCRRMVGWMEAEWKKRARGSLAGDLLFTDGG